jgi:hypothetical protein
MRNGGPAKYTTEAENPNPVKDGVPPLDGKSEDIPPGAKWTKIDRRLVNPQSLEEEGERFEEELDCVSDEPFEMQQI